jgi:hypothetical protein
LLIDANDGELAGLRAASDARRLDLEPRDPGRHRGLSYYPEPVRD